MKKWTTISLFPTGYSLGSHIHYPFTGMCFRPHHGSIGLELQYPDRSSSVSHPDLASQHTSALLGLPRRTQAMSPAEALPPVLHRHLSNGIDDMPLQHCLSRQEFHSTRWVFSLGGRPHLHTHRVAHYTPYSRITHSTLVGLSIPKILSNHNLLEYSLLRAESQKTEQQNHT